MKCCFIGHRKIDSEKLFPIVKDIISSLIEEGYTSYLFGSRSKFDDLCYEIVSEFRESYPEITRTFVRAEYEYISDDYQSYLLESYEDTYFPKEVSEAGSKSYVKRNQAMINDSDICVFYYDDSYEPTVSNRYLSKNSGTAIAYKYAIQKKKKIIRIDGNFNIIRQ